MWSILPLLFACAGGSGPQAPQTPHPDIVLVVVDTLRVDRLSAYGYARPTSPALEALAARGLRFDRAYAQSGWTLASFTSLFTGLYPHEHRVIRDPFNLTGFGRLGPEHSTLAGTLKAQGYRTAAFVNNTFIAPEFGLNQGFDTYDFHGSSNVMIRSAADTVEAGLSWLGKSDDAAFLVLHFMEPHADYLPPEDVRGKWSGEVWPESIDPKRFALDPFALMQAGQLVPDQAGKQFVSDRYDEEILGLDPAFARLVAALDARGRWDQTLLVVTADHGEELWDHGRYEHGHSLLGELTLVPLIAVGDGLKPGVVDTLVEHTDLFQGLLARAGATPPAGSHGEDLFTLAQAPQVNRFAMSENCLYGPSCISMVDETARLILMGSSGAVLRVAPDKTELEQLQGPEAKAEGQRLRSELLRRRGSLDPMAAVSGPEVPSYEVFSQLAAMGYIDDRPAGTTEEAPTEAP